MYTFYYVDAVTSAGKTREALLYAAAHPGENFCLVMPSIDLIDSKIDWLKTDPWVGEHFPNLAKRVRCFHSGNGDTSVVGRIIDFLKTMPSGVIMFITHSAWQLLPDFHRKDLWHLVTDEMMQSTWNQAYTVSYEDHRALLVNHLRATREDDTYSRIEAKDHGTIRTRATNRYGDPFAKILQPLFAKLTASSEWTIFVETDQWSAFVAGDIRQIEFHGTFHPAAFDGYASVTFMGANLTETLTYHHFSNMGVTFLPHKPITKALRYSEHTNGSRLTIKYFTNRAWSKTLHKLAIIVDDEQMTVFDCFKRAIRKEFKGHDYLWLANAHSDYDNALAGVRLPNVPHGLDQYQGYHRCAILSALNPTPAHGVFLQCVAQITERQIRRALLSETSYQAMGRGSMRNPDATEDFVLIVPDKMTADDIASLYPGCKIELLMGYDPCPRSKRYSSDEDRQQARRDTYKRANAKRNSPLCQGNLLYPSPSQEQEPSLPLLMANHHEISLLKHIGDKKPVRETHDTNGMIEKFRDLHCDLNRSMMKKQSAGMFSPTIWPSDTPDRTNENIEYCSSVIAIDDDGSTIPPTELARFFTDSLNIPVVICNTASSNRAQQRLRIITFADRPMTPDEHEKITHRLGDLIRQYAITMGHEIDIDWGKALRHGIFYLPQPTKDSQTRVFIAHNEQPLLNTAQWLQDVDQWLSAMPEPEAPQPLPEPDYATDRHDPKYFPAISRWRARSAGQGNYELNRLAWALAARGMPISDVEQVLKDEASMLGASRVDREHQIPYIVKHLSQNIGRLHE